MREEVDRNLMAAAAVGEVTRRDGELGSLKRTRQPTPHEAVRAIGADDESRERQTASSLELDAVRLHRDVSDSCLDEFSASLLGGSKQRLVEVASAGNHEAGNVSPCDRAVFCPRR